MNEEFGVLKDMIPACEGHEMHKLAILQASIEYMRYLETCLEDLKTVHGQCPTKSSASPGIVVATARSNSSTPLSQDTEMQDLPPLRQAISATMSSSYPRLPSISPALLPNTRTNSTHPSPYHGASIYPWPNPTGSALPSPAFEPQSRGPSHIHHGSFKLSSPAMSPTQMPEDHEATAALLMLNADRRNWNEINRDQRRELPKPTESMATAAPKRFSVKDLLAE